MTHNERELKTFAANLLLAGRLCVLAGGGKVASRKLKSLLDAGGRALVVAPDVSPAVEELCRSSGSEIRKREFRDFDIDGAFLVIAATDDASLNRHLAELCASKGVLCCAADSSWPLGSFIAPASFEADGLKIAISSGGASCRRSRMLKDSLARHVKALEGADIAVIGFDHSSLPLDERERRHLIGSSLEEAGEALSCIWGLHEFMLLNTCNRLELICVLSPGEHIQRLIVKALGLEGACYVKRSWDAFSHLPALAAGMLSQTPGEKHIVSQLKDALELARSHGWAGSLIQNWFDVALHISKHIRAEAEPLCGACEIEDLALRYIKEQLGSLDGLRTVVVGAGEIGAAIVERLAASGCEVEWLYRSRKPASLPDGVKLFQVDALPERLAGCRVLVSAASAKLPLLSDASAAKNEMLIIDLGVPRNISPEIAKGNNSIKLVDLEALRLWRTKEFIDVDKLLEISRKTITEHREMHGKIIAGLQGGD